MNLKISQSNGNKKNITFKLNTESEYPNIENIEIKLYNKSDFNEINIPIIYQGYSKENNLFVYNFSIDSTHLTIGKYYIKFDDNDFNDYELIIQKEKI